MASARPAFHRPPGHRHPSGQPQTSGRSQSRAGAHRAVRRHRGAGLVRRNRDGPYGLVDVRRAVASRQRRRPSRRPTSGSSSDHSTQRRRRDGVWGGVPLEFRRFMFNQTVGGAILDAYRSAGRAPSTTRGPTSATSVTMFELYDAANRVHGLRGPPSSRLATTTSQPFATSSTSRRTPRVWALTHEYLGGAGRRLATPCSSPRFASRLGRSSRTLGAHAVRPTALLEGRCSAATRRSSGKLDDHARRGRRADAAARRPRR